MIKILQEKRMVLEEWSESDFKSRGFRIAFRKYWIPIVVILVAFMVGLTYVGYIPDKTVSDLMGVLLVLLLLACFALFYFEVGGKYWKKIKKMEQPIKLGKVPSLWWLFSKNKNVVDDENEK